MVSIDLDRSLVVVTGAAGGIGAAVVAVLRESGATVAALDIAGERLESLYGDDPGVHTFAIDVTNERAVEVLAQRLTTLMDESHPRDDRLTLRGVVHSAGLIAYSQSIADVVADEWRRVMSVNIESAYLLSRHCLPLMEGGSIILFSSLAAQVGGIEVGIHYASSKAGLIGFARTLAKEAGPRGVRVNTLAPGIIGTAPVLEQIGNHKESYEQTIPLRRIGEPEDVANAVLFLCSDLSKYITGATLNVNGGIYMG
jgi:NAD(P)-dependent dehydrogenase (short-subunit alcohol dehydrogenase family)